MCFVHHSLMSIWLALGDGEMGPVGVRAEFAVSAAVVGT